MTIFAERLKELRKKNKVTQAELTLATFITQSTISKYERGEIEPSASVLIKIADFFNVSIDYLCGRDK